MTVHFEEFITTEELVRLYYCEGKSLDELADYLGVDRKTLISYMDNLNLPRRQNAGGRKSRGPACPYCGAKDSKIYRAYWHVPGAKYYRYRQCRACSGRFRTIEQVTKTLEGGRGNE